jgi:hypothetical protein
MTWWLIACFAMMLALTCYEISDTIDDQWGDD